MNAIRYTNLLLSGMNSKGVGFSIVANARTAELPEGDCAKAYKALKAMFAPGTVAERMDLEKDFRNCVLKSAKTEPDVWFNELEGIRFRLGTLGSSIDEDTILAHLLNSLPKDYGSLQQAQRSLLEIETETVRHVTVESLKRAIRNAYKDMKSTSKDPEEAFFAKKFKGTCNKCGKQGHKGPD